MSEKMTRCASDLDFLKPLFSGNHGQPTTNDYKRIRDIVYRAMLDTDYREQLNDLAVERLSSLFEHSPILFEERDEDSSEDFNPNTHASAFLQLLFEDAIQHFVGPLDESNQISIPDEDDSTVLLIPAGAITSDSAPSLDTISRKVRLHPQYQGHRIEVAASVAAGDSDNPEKLTRQFNSGLLEGCVVTYFRDGRVELSICDSGIGDVLLLVDGFALQPSRNIQNGIEQAVYYRVCPHSGAQPEGEFILNDDLG